MPKDIFTGMWRRYFRHTEGVFFFKRLHLQRLFTHWNVFYYTIAHVQFVLKQILIYLFEYVLCGRCLYECISLNSNIWSSLIYKCCVWILNLWTVSGHISFIDAQAFDPLSGYACVCRITQCSSHTMLNSDLIWNVKGTL